jgi:hypothetical protein
MLRRLVVVEHFHDRRRPLTGRTGKRLGLLCHLHFGISNYGNAVAAKESVEIEMQVIAHALTKAGRITNGPFG